MKEQELTSNQEAVIDKWEEHLNTDQPFSNADFFNLGLAILRSHTGSNGSSNEIELQSPFGEKIVIGYLPEDAKASETFYFDTPQGGSKTISREIRRTGDVYHVFDINVDEAIESTISLSTEERSKIAKKLLQAHHFSPVKHRAATIA